MYAYRVSYLKIMPTLFTNKSVKQHVPSRGIVEYTKVLVLFMTMKIFLLLRLLS